MHVQHQESVLSNTLFETCVFEERQAAGHSSPMAGPQNSLGLLLKKPQPGVGDLDHSVVADLDIVPAHEGLYG